MLVEAVVLRSVRVALWASLLMLMAAAPAHAASLLFEFTINAREDVQSFEATGQPPLSVTSHTDVAYTFRYSVTLADPIALTSDSQGVIVQAAIAGVGGTPLDSELASVSGILPQTIPTDGILGYRLADPPAAQSTTGILFAQSARLEPIADPRGQAAEFGGIFTRIDLNSSSSAIPGAARVMTLQEAFEALRGQTFAVSLGAIRDSSLIVNGEVSRRGSHTVTYSGTARFISASVPEPGTWILLIAGFGASGLALRRTRPSARLATPA